MNKTHSTASLYILQRLEMSAFMTAAIFADATGGFQAHLKAEMFLNQLVSNFDRGTTFNLSVNPGDFQ